MTEFTVGELFVYTNGDRWELGMVKRENNTGDGYFCYCNTSIGGVPECRFEQEAIRLGVDVDVWNEE